MAPQLQNGIIGPTQLTPEEEEKRRLLEEIRRVQAAAAVEGRPTLAPEVISESDESISRLRDRRRERAAMPGDPSMGGIPGVPPTGRGGMEGGIPGMPVDPRMGGMGGMPAGRDPMLRERMEVESELRRLRQPVEPTKGWEMIGDALLGLGSRHRDAFLVQNQREAKRQKALNLMKEREGGLRQQQADIRQARIDEQARRESEARIGQAEAATETQRLQVYIKRLEMASPKEQELAKDEFELWQRQNPNGTAEEWLNIKAEEVDTVVVTRADGSTYLEAATPGTELTPPTPTGPQALTGLALAIFQDPDRFFDINDTQQAEVLGKFADAGVELSHIENLSPEEGMLVQEADTLITDILENHAKDLGGMGAAHGFRGFDLSRWWVLGSAEQPSPLSPGANYVVKREQLLNLLTLEGIESMGGRRTNLLMGAVKSAVAGIDHTTSKEATIKEFERIQMKLRAALQLAGLQSLAPAPASDSGMRQSTRPADRMFSTPAPVSSAEEGAAKLNLTLEEYKAGIAAEIAKRKKARGQ